MLKKIRKWAAVFLCGAMCICGCSGEDSAQEQEKPVDTETKKEQTKKKEKEYQKKLDIVKPSAYDNVMGLNLE